jgi:hypothetical protein
MYPEEDSKITEDISSLENIYISTVSNITNKGFFPVCRELVSDNSIPLINLKEYRSENIKIKIDFIGLTNSPKKEPRILVYRKGSSTPIEEFVMRRNIEDSENPDKNKSFLPDNIILGDKDSSLISANISYKSTIAISLCVVAYGLDSQFSPIYSEMIFLNRDKYTPLEISF